MSKIKIRNKKILKHKLDVYLKCGEIEKYLSIKKRIVNKTLNAPNLFFNLNCVKNARIENCKFNILDIYCSNTDIGSFYKNVLCLGNRKHLHYGYNKSDLINYKNRKKFKNKCLK